MKNKIKKCSVCGAEIAESAKTCPQCGAKNKKPVFKQKWFIAIIVVILLITIIFVIAPMFNNFKMQINKNGQETVMSARELQNLALTDLLEAERIADGAKVTFTAKIDSTEKFLNDGIKIGFEVSDINERWIYAEKAELNNMVCKVGDKVTISGTIYIYDNHFEPVQIAVSDIQMA